MSKKKHSKTDASSVNRRELKSADASSDEHEVDVWHVGVSCWAICSCGWTGPIHQRERFAKDDGDQHVADQEG